MVGSLLREGVVMSGWSSEALITVPGLPIAALAAGRDLIKIDAEGIEAALIAEIRPLLVERRPTLLVEVLPEAARLGELLAAVAAEAGYRIFILPEYGSDTPVEMPASRFTALSPGECHSKDVVLTAEPIA